jgi:hypothetical protein
MSCTDAVFGKGSPGLDIIRTGRDRAVDRAGSVNLVDAVTSALAARYQTDVFLTAPHVDRLGFRPGERGVSPGLRGFLPGSRMPARPGGLDWARWAGWR